MGPFWTSSARDVRMRSSCPDEVVRLESRCANQVGEDGELGRADLGVIAAGLKQGPGLRAVTDNKDRTLRGLANIVGTADRRSSGIQ